MAVGLLAATACVAWASLALVPLHPALTAPPPATVVTDRHGEPIHTRLSSAGQRQVPLRLADVSPHLVNATLGGEDHRFFSHVGVDPYAVARAAWLNARRGGAWFGASTLTQQVVRLCLPGARTWSRKLVEAFHALVLERHRTKEEILEMYLSRAPYGGHVVGAEAAATYWFGVPASRLSLAQASLLSVIPRAPNRYDPRRDLAAALRRRAHVLSLMVARGVITQEQERAALDEPLDLLGVPPPTRAPHAAWAVLSETPPGVDRVVTTLDGALQSRVEVLVARTVEELRHRGVTQAAALVVEVPGGQVRAYVGSADVLDVAHHGQVDGIRSHRSPGSTLKPIIYGAALAQGMTAATLLHDVSRPFPAQEGVYLPRNFDGREHGPVRLRTALASSWNLAAVDVAERLGERRVFDAVLAAGLRPVQSRAEEVGLGVVLGGVDVTPWDVATAYLVLARGGTRVPLKLVEDAPRVAPVRIMPADVAWLITDILSDDDARAPSFGRHSALQLPYPAAVKTGTSKDFRDNWAAGFTTRWLVVTWAGDFDARSMKGVSGITGAGTLWHRIMRQLHADADPPPFAVPAGVHVERICALSGARAGPGCPHAVEESFLSGTEPQLYCAFHATPGRVTYPAELQGWAQRQGGAVVSADAPRVVFPKDGQVLRRDPHRAEDAQGFHVMAAGPEGAPLELWWDGVPLARGTGGVRALVKAVPGPHVVEARGADGRVHRVTCRVED